MVWLLSMMVPCAIIEKIYVPTNDYRKQMLRKFVYLKKISYLYDMEIRFEKRPAPNHVKRNV